MSSTTDQNPPSAIRNGKIARLPRPIRDELNQRLDSGVQGKDLVKWLNSLEYVKDTLRDFFGGRPINEQNLSEWKLGGFRDWQRQQEAAERMGRLAELSEDLDDAAMDRSIPEHLASVFAMELAMEARKLLEETSDPRERWKYLCEALRQLHELRKGDHIAARTRANMARLQVETEERDWKLTKKRIKEEHARVMEPIEEAKRRPSLEMVYGGKVADFIIEMDRTYRPRRFIPGDKPRSNPPASESNPDQTSIKPRSSLNQT